MRRDSEEIICCNHLITTEMIIVLSQNNEKTWVWDTTADLSEAVAQRERILARFSTAEIADEFSEVFESCPVELMNRTLVNFEPIRPSTPDGTDSVLETKSETPQTNSNNKDTSCRAWK